MNPLANVPEASGHLSEVAAMNKDVLGKRKRVRNSGELVDIVVTSKETSKKMGRVHGEGYPSSTLVNNNVRQTLKVQDQIDMTTETAVAYTNVRPVHCANTNAISKWRRQGDLPSANVQGQIAPNVSRCLRREDYTIGWICALPVELAAAQEMLDEEHDINDCSLGDINENLYTLGSISGHNVVITCLPASQIGNNPAAAVATQITKVFKSLKFALLVGIGGGVPSADTDIRLGDVVVSRPHQKFGGVIQFDIGKATPNRVERIGSLYSPPPILLDAVASVRAKEFRGRSKISDHISKLSRIPKFQRAAAGLDILFEAAYNHKGDQTCNQCEAYRQEVRQQRESEGNVVVHFGTIASGNQDIRDGRIRDKLSSELGGVVCFEMEAAGLINTFPSLMIRGICDYADSHKNKRWQAYAAATAAAYAKELLSLIPPGPVAESHTAKETATVTGISGRTTVPVYCIPFSRNPYFVGRSAELDVLQQKLMIERDCQRLSIVGLGGTGKTQVALQFAYTVKERWPEFSVFWVPALSMESFEQAYANIAEGLRIPYTQDKEDIKELVRQYLSTGRARRWLLVLDNADDPDILFGTSQSKGIVDYLPASEDGLVVYTTRALEVAVSLTRSDVIELGPMNRQDATNFLKKSLVKKDVLEDGVATMELLDELACLPLAIAQAAAYLNRNRPSVTKYVQLLRNTEQDVVNLMSREFHDDTRYRDSANAVVATWVISFRQIQVRDAAAADLLAFMACIEWKAIPRSLLPLVQPEGRMTEIIGTLCGYSFLMRRENGDQEEERGEERGEEWYDIHRLVHLATRIWIAKHADTAKVVDKAVQHVTEVFPSDNYTNRAVWRAYLPHALRLLRSMQGRGTAKKSKLSLLVGQCLYVDGRIQEAVEWLEESCQWRARLPEEDVDRLTTQRALAKAYQAHGQVKKAVELLQHAVAVQEKVNAREHPDRLASQHALATAYRADGQVKKAVELLEYVVKVQEKVNGREHSGRLASQHALATAYQADRQVKKAVELLEHVVAVQEKVKAEEHPGQLASQHALAEAYQADGQVEKAMKLLEHIVAVSRAHHTSTLDTANQLANLYRLQSKLDAAEEMYQRAGL